MNYNIKYTVDAIDNQNYNNKIILKNSDNLLNAITNDIIYISQNNNYNNYILYINNQIYSFIFNNNFLCNNLLKYYYISINSKNFTLKKHRSNIEYGYHLIEPHDINNIEIFLDNKQYIKFFNIQKIVTITKNPIIIHNTYMAVNDNNFLTLFVVDNKIICSLSLYDYNFHYINYYGYILNSKLNIKIVVQPDQSLFLHKSSKLEYKHISENAIVSIDGNI